jgi:hypothetical protein
MQFGIPNHGSEIFQPMFSPDLLPQELHDSALSARKHSSVSPAQVVR